MLPANAALTRSLVDQIAAVQRRHDELAVSRRMVAQAQAQAHA